MLDRLQVRWVRPADLGYSLVFRGEPSVNDTSSTFSYYLDIEKRVCLHRLWILYFILVIEMESEIDSTFIGPLLALSPHLEA